MKFDTAVFYDIENLIGGYGLSQLELLANLSLKQITEQIKQKNIDKIAIQRAYADWSVSRLNQIKEDMVELGIEPKQMFGFGKGIIRNASDIQLTIDVMEVLFTKPGIETFVIVSGDGGFSALANKLHEYGKEVIGCAYKRSTNKMFESIADEFIWLNEPNALAEHNAPDSFGHFGENYLISFAKQFKPLQDVSLESAQKVSQEIFGFFSSNHDIRSKLISHGLNISVFIELLRYRLSGFQHKFYGYTRNIDFLQSVIKKSELKIVLKGTSDYKLTLKNNRLAEYVDVITGDNPHPEHSLGNYKLILSTESPSFRQFDKQILSSVSSYLCENKHDYQNVLLDDVTHNLNSKFEYDSLEVVKTITSLISGGCFTLNAECKSLSNQKLSFVPHNTEQTFTLLEKAMEIKLCNRLSRIDSMVFNGIFN
jgi:uncharacterized LabA/DUF88 family protein